MAKHLLRHTPRWTATRVSALVAAVMVFAGGCSEQPPYRIGFVGGLTGRVADLGLSGMNGAVLAVEQINARGGINGRPLELVIRDDGQTPEGAELAVTDLVRQRVTAIVGHMTSSMSNIGAPIASAARVLMISPTTSTNDLSRVDDYFLRVYPASSDAAATLARHAYSARGFRRISVLYDLANRAHTEGWLVHFKQAYESLGGRIPLALPYTSGGTVDFSALAEGLAAPGPDAVFILANALDTALVCQQFRKKDLQLPILTSEWAATPEVVEFGGASVNGMEFLHTFDHESQEPEYLAFARDFRDRFGLEPGFASAHAYDCVRIVAAGLGQAKSYADLKKTILDQSRFQGLQDLLVFDSYGDISRQYHLMTIKEGAFTRVRQ